MKVFESQISLAKYAWEKGEHHNVIAALEIAFTSNFYQDVKVDKIIEGIDKSFSLVSSFFEFSEIRQTNFSKDFIHFLHQKIDSFRKEGFSVEKLASFVGDFRLILSCLYQAIKILKKHEVVLGQEKQKGISVGIKETSDNKIIIQTYHQNPKISSQNTNQDEIERIKKEFYMYFVEGKNTERKTLFAIASNLLNLGEHWTSIEAFEQIAELYPQEKASCENMIGANYFYLQKYEKALERYLNALTLGEDKEMMEYNIWEVCTKLMEQSVEDKQKWKEVYDTNFPEGKMKFE